MPKIYPFKPIIPTDNDKAKQVVCLPYDVFSYEEAKRKVADAPHSILSVTRSDVFFDEADAYQPFVYQRAKDNLNALLQEGFLKREQTEGFYIYSQTWRGRTQIGLVCLSDLGDYQHDLIKKHEKTRPEKEIDRITHIATLEAQTGNVFLAYRHHDELHQLLNRTIQYNAPLFEVDERSSGVLHRVWKIEDVQTLQRIQRIFQDHIQYTYIADGHHRAASAFRLFEKNPQNHTFLTTIFSDRELEILPYNRVVRNVAGHSTAHILQHIAKHFKVVPDEAFSGGLGIYIEGKWYRLELLDTTTFSDILSSLDAEFLQTLILQPIFQVNDPRKDKHIEFIGGIHGLKKLEDLVNQGKFDVAFSLPAVTMQQLFEVADQDKTMPPKSTWFEPKLLDGFFTALMSPCTPPFTLEQIKDTHSKVKSGADFPAYIRAMKTLGVSRYDVRVSDGQTEYMDESQRSLVSPAKYDKLSVASSPDLTQFRADLLAHQQGKTDYMTFCKDCAKSGIAGWVISIPQMTCTYYDTEGRDVLVENIPQ